MSILIKEMRMPKSCHECVGNLVGFCEFTTGLHLHERCPLTEKPEWCPLIELPNADEFAEDMRTAAKITDEEASHSMMDDIMCGILCQIGYEEAVAIFDNTPKWHA